MSACTPILFLLLLLLSLATIGGAGSSAYQFYRNSSRFTSSVSSSIDNGGTVLSSTSSLNMATEASPFDSDATNFDPHRLERNLGAALGDPSLITNLYPPDNSLTIHFDPPPFHAHPTALGVFVYCSDLSAKIYYTLSTFYAPGGKAPVVSYPTLSDNYATQARPYIHVDTPYLASRNRTLIAVAVSTDSTGNFIRSRLYEIPYFVEAGNRPNSAFFLVPGIEGKGYFLRVELEVKAKARAQTAGGQEFADFFTKLGVGPYDGQVQALNLPKLDEDFNGYEGGAAVNTTNGQHFAIIAPYHNGRQFHGNVVRINMVGMKNATSCLQNYRIESLYKIAGGSAAILATSLPYNSTHRIRVIRSSNTVTRANACVFVLKLEDINPKARGFRRLFVAHPYAYLSPGEYDVPVRLDMENFGLDTVRMVDLEVTLPGEGLGGYSGGFADGSWACFVPLRTYFGPIGGYRSKLEVDEFHLRHYYHGKLLCLNETAFQNSSAAVVRRSYRTIDISDFSPELRGFSDGIRVGRFAYLSPYAYDSHIFTGKVIRIDLGYKSIGDTIDQMLDANLPVSSILRTLDLSKKDPSLKGFSGIFTAGEFIYLVPSRNAHEPANGQRGHGNFVKISMNDFTLSGVEYIDLPNTQRTQIPSFADVDLRGFSYGFASGKYGVLVPFYNAVFSGKLGRLVIFGAEGLKDNLQELDLKQDYYGALREKAGHCVDCDMSFVFKGFRGGFISLWQGVEY